MSDLQAAWTQFNVTISDCERLRAGALDPGLDNVLGRMLLETVLMRAFRAFENLLEDAFLSYVAGEPDLSGAPVRSYLVPRDRSHARRIIGSESGRFLDWADEHVVRERARTYLHPDSPIYTGLAAGSREIQWARRIRNHIAHNSVESREQYRKVVIAMLSVEPLELPGAGELLYMVPTRGAARRRVVLQFLMDALKKAGGVAVAAPATPT